MAYSYQQVTGDGSTVQIPLTIGFLDRADISVTVNNVLNTTWTWLSPTINTIVLTAAPGVGVPVLIQRRTKLNAIRHTYSLGALFSTETLDANFKQLLYLAQEAYESAMVGGSAVLDNAKAYTDSAVAALRTYVDATALGLRNYIDSKSYAASSIAADDSASGSLFTTVAGFISRLRSSAGAALIGFSRGLSGAVRLTIQDMLRTHSVTVQEFGGVCDGVADDTAAFRSALAAAPEGGFVKIKGFIRITDSVVVTRRIGVVCESAADAIIVDLDSITKDGFMYSGPVTAINDIEIKLNVYGKANCCRNAVVLQRVDRSPNIEINVYAGAVQYGTCLQGLLINKIIINSSVNFAPPPLPFSPAFQRHHVYMAKALGVSVNDNDIWVNLEGGGIGLYSDPNMTGEGNNFFSGCIEGLATDTPIYINGVTSAAFRNLHCEANSLPSQFINCRNLQLGPAVINPGYAQRFQFQNSAGINLDEYFGEYEIDNNCSFARTGATLTSDPAKQPQKGYFNSVESVGVAANISGVNTSYGQDGSFTLENLFNNPFMDVWSNGVSAAPDGWYANSAAVEQAVYPLPTYTSNTGSGKSLRVTYTGVSSPANGAFGVLNSPYLQFSKDNYLSAFIPIYVASGQPDVMVFGFSGTGQYYTIGLVTAKDKWVDVRGAWICPASTLYTGAGVTAIPWNTATNAPIAAGQFYIGGLSIVLGTRAPKHLCDHGRRATNIAPNITYAPSFKGQMAIVGTKVYIANGSASPNEWQLLN